MSERRHHKKKAGRRPNIQTKRSTSKLDPLGHAVTLLDTICLLAGAEHLIQDIQRHENGRLRRAIVEHDTPALFGWLIDTLSLQGISDQVATSYMERHGRVTWADIEAGLSPRPSCAKLVDFSSFERCGFRKNEWRCSEPDHFLNCPLPRHDLRNGRLNQTAYSLFLFLRDVAENDLVEWIDQRIAGVTPLPRSTRTRRLHDALLNPMTRIVGASNKVLMMSLSDLLIATSETKRDWLEIGASMIAIDTLVHNFLDRTGILYRFDARHSYGPACYRSNGCAEIITRVSNFIDARHFNASYPKVFPRFVQHAMWSFCAQQHSNVCNGNKIDDTKRCNNKECVVRFLCDRMRLNRT
ncbi:MAG: hypothetical protein AB1490_05325 [Pseudomonadota bacterium]